MKKLITLIILITLLATGNIFAQQDDNASVAASAEVGSAVVVNGPQPLNFANIVPGTNASVTVIEGSPSGEGSIGSTTEGRYTIDGSANATLSLAFTIPAALDRDGGAETLPISFDNADYGYHSGALTAAANFNPDATVTTPLEITINATADQILVQLGGQVQPANDQVAGTYAGTVTLTVTQNI